jgi:hypothetical protein
MADRLGAHAIKDCIVERRCNQHFKFYVQLPMAKCSDPGNNERHRNLHYLILAGILT